MENRPKVQGARWRRRVVMFAIVAVLLAFFSVPIAILLYGGVATAIGGLTMVGALVVFQLPVFILLKKAGVLPPVDRDE